MKLILKGFIIGIGKIMPGVSGAMIAMSLNEYEKIIESIANIKNNFYENTKYLSKHGIGIILAIVITSKIIVNSLNNHYFPTMLLFLGIITGGTIKKIKKINKKKLILSVTLIIATLSILNKISNNNINLYRPEGFIKIMGAGILDAISSIIPGISGTALLMYFGYYDKIINTFATISDTTKLLQNIKTLIPFMLGFIIGTVIIAKVLNKIIKRHQNAINIIVGSLMLYTLIILSFSSIKKLPNTYETIIGIILYTIELTLSMKTSNKK